MKTALIKTVRNGLLIGVLAACSQPDSEPTLPAGAKTKSVQFRAESFLRGVVGDNATSPRGRPSSILSVTYSMTCLAENGQSRIAQAKDQLTKAYVVAPLYFDNPRERGGWRAGASDLVFPLGCIVEGVNYSDTRKSEVEAFLWAVKHRVPPVR